MDTYKTARTTRTTSVSRIVSPEEAKQWLENNSYIYQRPLNKRAVRKYRIAMEQGFWIPGGQIEFAVQAATGKVTLVNGQHRLHAQVDSNTSQEYVITRVTYTTDEELAALYSSRDRGHGRTPGQAMRAYGIQDDLGLSNWQLNSAIAAIGMISTKFTQGSRHATSDAEMAKEIMRYRTGIDKYFESVPPKELYFTVIRRAPVVALGIVLYQYATHVYGEDMVNKFIDGAIYGNNISDGDPRKLAFIHLGHTELRSKTVNERSGVKGVTAEYQIRYLIHCWNAFSEGRQLTVTKVVGNLSDPVKINGTPWKGK